ncbi:MAG: 4Fe-4S dicluster domain-containing protein [Candidatus Eisenbacteria bacterium]
MCPTRVRLSRENVNGDFVKLVNEISGQNVLNCYQCGRCSSGCPLTFAMRLLPNQVIRFVQLGLKEEAMETNTHWVCASCLACHARCPRGVDLAKVMEALRAIGLRPGTHDRIRPEDLPAETLAKLPQQALVSGLRKFTK